MPLFREHPIRSTVCIVVALVLGHTLVTRLLNSFYALHLTQTSVAILGVSGFMFLIAMNHRRGEEGRFVMTEMQEEMALIIGFGLLSIVIWGWITGKPEGGSGASGRVGGRGGGGGARPYPCSDDDILCIVEEYSYI